MTTKVGILSMQRIQNYGSFLQAYGLKCILEEIGCEVQFVDYHPGSTLISSNGRTGVLRKLSKVIDVLKLAGPLKEKIRFIKYKKNYAANYYQYLGITEERNYNPELDVLIIGSDEVFNCVQDNPNVGFCPELFGQGRKSKKLVSYAASFGNTTLDKLEQYGINDKVAKWLYEFDAVSVRDNNSGDIVKVLIGCEPEYHLDPVLAYDYVGVCKKIPKNIPHKNYLLLYGYSGRFTNEECRMIRRYADSRGLKILCIGGVQSCCDRFIDVDPFTVIAYFHHADFVVTDTFHGTIMSVITHRLFVSVVRDGGYANSQKLNDLLQRLNLTSRKLKINEGLNIIEQPINYSETEEIIRRERKRTKIYLEQWVK